jgi:hypothetical protein
MDHNSLGVCDYKYRNANNANNRQMQFTTSDYTIYQQNNNDTDRPAITTNLKPSSSVPSLFDLSDSTIK